MFDPSTHLRAGATVRVRSEHPDAVDTYEFRLLSDGASVLDCVLPELPDDTFRGEFTEEALATGDGLLAVKQTNPYGAGTDGQYREAGRPQRTYLFAATTPPFLLSARLAANVRDRQPISLRFYDFLDDDPLQLAFASASGGTIDVDGQANAIRVIRCKGPDADLEVVAGTPFVTYVSRSQGDFGMRVAGIRTS